MRRPRLPLHEHCLFKNGIHLGELWYLTRAGALAARARPQPLPADRAAAAAARRGRLAGDADRDGLNRHRQQRSMTSVLKQGRRKALVRLRCWLQSDSASLVAAQAAWPDKPVKLVVPYAAVARPMHRARRRHASSATRLKQQVIVENKAGAGGTIGAQAVAQGAGRRLHVPYDATSFTVNPSLFPSWRSTRPDFVPVGQVDAVPTLLVVPANSPVNARGGPRAGSARQSRQDELCVGRQRRRAHLAPSCSSRASSSVWSTFRTRAARRH